MLRNTKYFQIQIISVLEEKQPLCWKSTSGVDASLTIASGM